MIRDAHKQLLVSYVSDIQTIQYVETKIMSVDDLGL
jgi:hypothetical protein